MRRRPARCRAAWAALSWVITSRQSAPSSNSLCTPRSCPSARLSRFRVSLVTSSGKRMLPGYTPIRILPHTPVGIFQGDRVVNLTSDTPGGVRIEGPPEPLVIRQLYLGCLSQAAYLIGDAESGRGIVVDPRRDVDEILSSAADEGLDIELVVLTHFHADFLSGHLEVSAATGAEVAFGSAAVTEFPSRGLHDGEVIDLGRVSIEVWETPG